MDDITHFLDGFELHYNEKNLLETLLAETTLYFASINALREFIIINLSQITGKEIEELQEEWKEILSVHKKDAIASLLSKHGRVEPPQKPE